MVRMPRPLGERQGVGDIDRAPAHAVVSQRREARRSLGLHGGDIELGPLGGAPVVPHKT